MSSSSSASSSQAVGGSIGSNNNSGGGVPWYAWVIGGVLVLAGAVWFFKYKK